MTRIVLVRPQGPRNVGSVLRLVTNFGPAELVLVAPPKPSLLIHPDFEQMSHGVEDVASKIRVVDSVEEALEDVARSYGFTARRRDHRELHDWRDLRPEIARTAASEPVALVFGSEENGLTVRETEPLQELVRMPTTNEHTSLNLAMSVGIVLSTLFFDGAPSAATQSSSPVFGRDRRFLVEHLKATLANLTTTAPARRDLVASIERVFARAPLETRDVRAWHLLARAVGSDKTPADFGLGPVESASVSENDPGDAPS